VIYKKYKIHRLHKNPYYRAVVVVTILFSLGWLISNVQTARSGGIDDVTITLSDSEALNTESRVQVVFTPDTALTGGDTITIYLAENTGGTEWEDDDADQSSADISCVQAGTTFNNPVYAAATASVPMYYSQDVNTGGNLAQVTCTLGSGAADAPNNPNTAGGFSIAVVTDDDAGAGVAYVGDANDIDVTVEVLPNLSLTIDNADASVCTTTGGGITSCDMGTVTTANVNTGNYDVNVGTNATTSASMKVNDDQDLTSGANTIADVIENNTVTAGVEGYGLQIVENGTEWTEVDPFDDDDTPITTSPVTVATSTGPADAAGDDVTITHRVAVSSITEAGNYSHTVTWTATADF
ncbi:MAG: hypothetical protein V1838_02395, partial [Patescibacteria group bacterium]